jgi:glycosyltransferase involved in cell wall biosynthesis
MRILIIADNPTIQSSYGKISYNLAKELIKKNIEVAFIGLQYIGSPSYVKIENKYITMYMGANTLAFKRAFKDFTPEYLIHIRDLFAFCPSFFPHHYSFINDAHNYGIKVINWTPVQSDNLPQEFIDATFKEGDLTLVFTKWGIDQLILQGAPYNKIKHLPLGVDKEIYKPKNVNKSEYGFSDKPLIGTIGVADQYRKAYPILLKAIAEVRKKYDVELYIHSSMYGSFHLPHFIENLGLKGYVSFPSTYIKEWGVDEFQMSEIINCFDIYASPTLAEGWNLPAYESLACGIPPVVSDSPNHKEVLGEFGFFVKSYKTYPTPWSFEWIPDYKDMAFQIIKILEMKESEKKEYKEKAVKHVISWSEVAFQLINIIGETFV